MLGVKRRRSKIKEQSVEKMKERNKPLPELPPLTAVSVDGGNIGKTKTGDGRLATGKNETSKTPKDRYRGIGYMV